MPYPVSAARGRVVTPAAAGGAWPTGTWWLPSGVTAADCIVAYQPKGAATLAESYTNIDNPGTDDAAPTVAPTWATASGWTFDGATQYLTLGSFALEPGSVFFRITETNLAAQRSMLGAPDSGLQLDITTGGTIMGVKSNLAVLATSTGVISAATDTVIGFTRDSGGGMVFYINGTSAGTGSYVTVISATSALIGATKAGGSPSSYWLGQMAAVAIYNRVLTGGEAAALSTAMSGL